MKFVHVLRKCAARLGVHEWMDLCKSCECILSCPRACLGAMRDSVVCVQGFENMHKYEGKTVYYTAYIVTRTFIYSVQCAEIARACLCVVSRHGTCMRTYMCVKRFLKIAYFVFFLWLMHPACM
jgi:hypothetical protein